MRKRVVFLSVVIVLAAAGCGLASHAGPVTAEWVSCEGGSCGDVAVRPDPTLVKVDIAGHSCAALDRFDGDIARDLGRAHGAVTVGFRYTGGYADANVPADQVPPDHLDYVTEVIIPVASATAQQAQADAESVPGACGKSLGATILDASQSASNLSIYTFRVRRLYNNNDLEENLSLAYYANKLIVARDTGGGTPSGPSISEDAVECSTIGGGSRMRGEPSC